MPFGEAPLWVMLFGVRLLYLCFGLTVVSTAPLVRAIRAELGLSHSAMGVYHAGGFSAALSMLTGVCAVMLLAGPAPADDPEELDLTPPPRPCARRGIV